MRPTRSCSSPVSSAPSGVLSTEAHFAIKVLGLDGFSQRFNAFAIPVRGPVLMPVLGVTDGKKPMEQGKQSKSPVPKFLRQRLRDRAIAGVRKDMIHAGRTEDSYSEEEPEYLVAEKERDIWSGIGWKGFGVAALLLGINIGI